MANRPLTMSDYIGQERIKKQLDIAIGASKTRNRPLPHLLFHGNPGLGKTTLAQIIANELGVKLHEVMASNLQTVEDIEGVLAGLTDKSYDVLFIDEIHRLSLKIEELLYPVMEDFIFEREVDGRLGRKEIRKFWVPNFTLIGATTLPSEISRPLRDRFGFLFQLQNYQEEEIAMILLKLAEREMVEIQETALFEIARRSKGVARIAINYLNRCKDYADFCIGDGKITSKVCKEQFELMGIDEMGLEDADYRVLKYLACQTRPVGLDSIASATDIDNGTIARLIEPYLIQKGLVNRTRSGREITEKGYHWISIHSDEPFDDFDPDDGGSNNTPIPQADDDDKPTRVGSI